MNPLLNCRRAGECLAANTHPLTVAYCTTVPVRTARLAAPLRRLPLVREQVLEPVQVLALALELEPPEQRGLPAARLPQRSTP